MVFLRVLLFAVLGAIVGYALTAVLGMALITPAPADSGGTAMGIFFGLAPLGGLVGMVVAIILAVKGRGRAK